MKTNLQLDKHFELAPTWKWRRANGMFVAPNSMETTHLFHVLRMIWNHSMPPQAHVGTRIRYYTFNSFYTAVYMKEAIHHIWDELACRTDLPIWAQMQLAEMHSWYANRLYQERRKLTNAQG